MGGRYTSPMRAPDGPHGQRTSEGWVDLPMRFEGQFLHLFYAVPAAPVRGRLAEVGLRPVTVRGRALVALDILHYDKSTVGPYLELSLGLVARGIGARSPGVWIDELPVTAPAARAAGCEIWGFPKTVRDIVLECGPGGIRAGLPGEAMVSLGAPRGPTVRLPLPLAPYSRHEGTLLRTPLRVTASCRLVPRTAYRLRLEGNGPMATAMRRYGVDTAEPFLASWGDAMVASLHPGRSVSER
jgi:hypothetical protein